MTLTITRSSSFDQTGKDFPRLLWRIDGHRATTATLAVSSDDGGQLRGIDAEDGSEAGDGGAGWLSATRAPAIDRVPCYLQEWCDLGVGSLTDPELEKLGKGSRILWF